MGNENTAPNGPVKYCSTCGAEIHALAEICPKCGVRQMPPPNAPQPPPQPTEKKQDPIFGCIGILVAAILFAILWKLI